MKNKLPLVSVIMPVYNGSCFVAKAIESILSQTYPRFELIIVDDGSTDDTWKILQKYRKNYPKIIRVFHFKKNTGESAAANLAFTKAKGQFVARMDADDVARGDRLKKQVDFLQNHPDVLIVGSQARVIDKNGRRIGVKRTPLTHEKIYKWIAFVNPMIHPSIMYRKSLLPKREFLYRNTFESTDDYHTYFELLRYGRFANIDDELISYRIHGHNKSLTNLKEKFWSDTRVRFNAVTRMEYHAPLAMFPVILLQMILVSLLPEKVLKELFFYARGIKKLPKISDFKFSYLKARIKRYALVSS